MADGDLKTYLFENETGYDFDSDLIEFSGGKVLLKELFPMETFYANYNTDINGSRGDGVLTGTGTGAPTITGGKLDLTGGTQYVDYAGLDNADHITKGCIQFDFTPNYSGAPATANKLFTICKAHNQLANMITIGHVNGGGAIGITMYDSASSSIVGYSTPTGWLPTAGQEYNFRFNYDFTVGSENHQLFIDDVQFGATLTNAGTRDANIGLLRIGAYYTGSSPVDGKYDNVQVFSEPQVATTLDPELAYSTANPTVRPKEYLLAKHVHTQTTDIGTTLAPDEVRKSWVVDGVEMYYNTVSGVWEVNSSLYANTNTSAELTEVVFDLLTVNTYARPVYWLHSDDGQSTPEIDTDVIEYLYNPAAIDVDIVSVFGYLYGINGEPIADGTVDVSLYSTRKPEIEVTTLNVVLTDTRVRYEVDADGGFVAALLTGYTYKFVFNTGNKKLYEEIRTLDTVLPIIQYDQLTKV